MFIKHNMLTSSYLFFKLVSVEEKRNAVDLMFCNVECADMSSSALSEVALQNVLICQQSSK